MRSCLLTSIELSFSPLRLLGATGRLTYIPSFYRAEKQGSHVFSGATLRFPCHSSFFADHITALLQLRAPFLRLPQDADSKHTTLSICHGKLISRPPSRFTAIGAPGVRRLAESMGTRGMRRSMAALRGAPSSRAVSKTARVQGETQPN
jgi:hypothetical protein